MHVVFWFKSDGRKISRELFHLKGNHTFSILDDIDSCDATQVMPDWPRGSRRPPSTFEVAGDRGFDPRIGFIFWLSCYAWVFLFISLIFLIWRRFP